MSNVDVQSAYADYDRRVRISNSKLGSVLAIILMPAGVSLDYFVYPDRVWEFLGLRLLCSLLVGIVWGLFNTSFGQKHYRVLGMTWYMLPAFFIAWMIYVIGDHSSPYYAGLNIVMIGAGLILPWTYQENLLAVGLVILMYMGAALLQPGILEFRLLYNNLYFLVLTGLIIVVASYYHSRNRFSEFALRFELDRNKHMLEEKNRELVELGEAKSRFFANISHELRTPLTLLLAPLETMLDSRRHSWNEEARELLETMNANGMRLLKLINDLLDLVRLESKKVRVEQEKVEVHEFVQGICHSVKRMAEDRKVGLDCRVPENAGAMFMDKDKMEKVLLNLVFNAIKFTPAGGRVEVSAERNAGQLILEVRDTGVGITAEHLPKVFDRFWQADTSSRRKYQGTGIGLALVKELVELQNGTVEAASEHGKGTTMTVRLPEGTPSEVKEKVEGPAERKEGEQPGQVEEGWAQSLYRRAELFPSLTSLAAQVRPVEVGRRSGRPKVLIADDEPDMLRFLRSQLQGRFDVVEAVDGQEALERAAQFLPDVILCDMMMPEKDGLEVCAELRKKISTQGIPVVMLTARADEETKIKALTAGATDFLTKPFSTTELYVRLGNLIETHEGRRKIARQNQVLEATVEQLKETESQLVQSEKLASLGRLSAGIIHEINNPINFAKTGLYTLRQAVTHLPEAERKDFEEVLADVEEGISRVGSIVGDLRTFTHPNAGSYERVDLKRAVSAAVRFVSHEWRGTVEMEIEIPEDCPVWGNHNQLVQLLVNMLQNSLDAIRQKEFDGERPKICLKARAGVGSVEVSISDNGKGIRAEDTGRVFDPFFTTKDVGEGMGLGLSICYRIIKDHRGDVRVESELGKGTVFRIDLPSRPEGGSGSKTETN